MNVEEEDRPPSKDTRHCDERDMDASRLLRCRMPSKRSIIERFYCSSFLRSPNYNRRLYLLETSREMK